MLMPQRQTNAQACRFMPYASLNMTDVPAVDFQFKGVVITIIIIIIMLPIKP
jgi:hypothetical protein